MVDIFTHARWCNHCKHHVDLKEHAKTCEFAKLQEDVKELNKLRAEVHYLRGTLRIVQDYIKNYSDAPADIKKVIYDAIKR